MTTALKTNTVSRRPHLVSQSEPITVLTYAGQYWNLRTMSGEEIKWLHAKFNADPLQNLRSLTACQAELERRRPGPAKVRVMVELSKNAGSLLEKFSEELVVDGLLLSDLAMGAGNNASTRYGEGLQLALDGRWEMPAALDWGFKVDSFPGEYGSRQYEVKCKRTRYSNYSRCSCDDFLYKAAGKLGGFCKHVCCVWFVCQAEQL